MRITVIIIILIIKFGLLKGQQSLIFERQLIATTGESKTLDNINYDWSMGEVIVDQSNIHYTQGFQQYFKIDLNFKKNPGTNYNTIITPGDNGYNNQLIFEKYPSGGELIIFDKWGTKLYYMRNYNGTFDGSKDNGESIPDGVYIFILNNYLGKLIYKGTITIKRK